MKPSLPAALCVICTLAVLASSASVEAQPPRIGTCPVFPADNIWNARVDQLPVDARSDAYVRSIGATKKIHADFGAAQADGAPVGIPFVMVPASQQMVAVVFAAFGDEPPYPDESDAGPAPIPPDAPIEGGPRSADDRHVIVVQKQTCILYELYKAAPNRDGSWNTVAIARFDLKSNALRPDGWTSSDAAGLPVFPGLVRYDEVAAGEITHALRFTAPKTRNTHVWPARHAASNSRDAGLPPMGQRFRLKADFDISAYSPDNQVILRALQTYGMILADNGSPWFITGAPDRRWNDDAVQGELRQLTGADFEAVDVSGLMKNANSAAVRR